MTIDEAKKKVLELARAQIGYHETGENLTKYTSAYDFDTKLYGFDMNGQPWCDYFVDWLFCETFGVDLGCKMTFQFSGCSGASCAMSAEYYADAGSFYSTPAVGDQIFFYSGGGINHTGIVEAVENGTVTTIEGNSSDSVKRSVYRLNEPSIAGYGRPAWKYAADRTDLSPADNTALTEEEAPGFTADLDADGEFGPLTEEAVLAFQRAFGLEEDGIVGPLTWQKIFEIIADGLPRKGSAGWLVTALQALLNHIGGEI